MTKPLSNNKQREVSTIMKKTTFVILGLIVGFILTLVLGFPGDQKSFLVTAIQVGTLIEKTQGGGWFHLLNPYIYYCVGIIFGCAFGPLAFHRAQAPKPYRAQDYRS